jgi:hypothetical protein
MPTAPLLGHQIFDRLTSCCVRTTPCFWASPSTAHDMALNICPQNVNMKKWVRLDSCGT